MSERAEADAYRAKAEESLASAEADFAAGRFNSCANRAYYACFQAAIAALLRDGIGPSGRDRQWRHDGVQAQFVGQLINRRRRYPAELRPVLADLQGPRQEGDYSPLTVTRAAASRSLRQARGFVETIRRSGG